MTARSLYTKSENAKVSENERYPTLDFTKNYEKW